MSDPTSVQQFLFAESAFFVLSAIVLIFQHEYMRVLLCLGQVFLSTAFYTRSDAAKVSAIIGKVGLFVAFVHFSDSMAFGSYAGKSLLVQAFLLVCLAVLYDRGELDTPEN